LALDGATYFTPDGIIGSKQIHIFLVSVHIVTLYILVIFSAFWIFKKDVNFKRNLLLMQLLFTLMTIKLSVQYYTSFELSSETTATYPLLALLNFIFSLQVPLSISAYWASNIF
jgi:hypothetical protein